MDTIIVVTAIALWSVLVVAAAIVPLIDTAGLDRNTENLSAPRWHDREIAGTQAA